MNLKLLISILWIVVFLLLGSTGIVYIFGGYTPLAERLATATAFAAILQFAILWSEYND